MRAPWWGREGERVPWRGLEAGACRELLLLSASVAGLRAPPPHLLLAARGMGRVNVSLEVDVGLLSRVPKDRWPTADATSPTWTTHGVSLVRGAFQMAATEPGVSK